jgi:hypothetical protein
VDPRRIKIHRCYTVEQLARALSCHKNAVWLWLKDGLESLGDGKRPIMIHGSVARRFLEERRKVRKRRCKPNELYCFRCREPRQPQAALATFEPSTASAGRLVGMCSDCGTRMFKRVSTKSLSELETLLTLKIHEPEMTPKLAA